MGAPTLTIDLDAIVRNWRALDAASARNVETGATVKADAYGLGLDRVAPALAAAGVQTFFVALAEEGARLRQILGDAPDIFVFSGYMPGDRDLVRDARLVPLLNSPQQAAAFLRDLAGHPSGLQMDSGMNRLGFEPADLPGLALQIPQLMPRLMISHLACADAATHAMNATQLTTFATMTSGLFGVRKSLSATGGILLNPGFHFDLTRPGIGLYGGAPFSDAEPVVTLTAPVIQTRSVLPGEIVGYGATWQAKSVSKIATIACGYADGLHRALAGTMTVHAGDVPCPVVGRVSMDLLTVDVTHLDTPPETLDILGAHQTIDQLAEAAGTIGYEILTSLGARHERVYRGRLKTKVAEHSCQL